MPSPTVLKSPIQGGFKGSYGLSGVSSPLAAFSVRKLFPNSPSACMRIRRNSDNVETDVPYCYDPIRREYIVCPNTLFGFTNYSDLSKFPPVGLDGDADGLSDGWSITQNTGTNVFTVSGGKQIITHENTAGTAQGARFAYTDVNKKKAVEGDIVSVTFRCRRPASTGGTIIVYLYARNSGGTALTSASMTVTSDTMASYTLTHTMPATTAYYEMFFLLQSSTLGHTVSAEVESVTAVSVKTSAYVTTWYDQSGSGYNIVQTTAAKQPRIVSVGTIDTQNSLPTVVFVAANTNEMTNAAVLNTATGLACVYAIKATGNNVVFGSGTSVTGISVSEISYVTNVSKATDRYPTGSDTSNSLKIITSENTGAAPTIYKNGTALSVGAGIGGSAYTGKLCIGSNGAGTYPSTADVSEAIVFTNFGDTERKALESSQIKFFKVV